MQIDDIEPPYTLALECTDEEFAEMLRWYREKVRKRLDVWRSGLAQVTKAS